MGSKDKIEFNIYKYSLILREYFILLPIFHQMKKQKNSIKRIITLSILFIYGGSIASAQCLINKDSWSIVFQEEFNGTSASDLAPNWFFDYTHGNVLSPGGQWFEPYNSSSNIFFMRRLCIF